MAGVSTQGLGSGLDIKTIVSNLVAAEQAPTKSRLDTREATVQAKLSTLGIVKSSISDFQTSVRALTSLTAFESKTASVGNGSLFTATTSSAAKAGQYSIGVDQLAQAQQLASGKFLDTTTAVGTGTLHIKFGTYSADSLTFTENPANAAKDIVIGTNQSSLQGIRDAVNAAGAGVSASIINDGSGDRLVFSAQSGAANSLQITATDDDANNTNAAGLSQLVFDPTTAGGVIKNMTETLAGKDAKLSINGISITRPTNTVSGALPGVTLNLQSYALNSPTTLTISEDKTKVSDAVNNFVNNFNALKSVLNKVTQYDASKKTAAVLTGDATIRGLNSQMQRVMGNMVTGVNGNVKALADIGITSARDGTLTLDAAKLDSTLNSNIDGFAALFATTGRATDSLISYSKAGSATKVGSYAVDISQVATHAQYGNSIGYGVGTTSDNSVTYVQGSSNSSTVPGSYALNITQLATQSTYSSTIGAGPFAIDGSNSSFSLKVDGNQSGTINLKQQSGMTGAQLAQELQTKINADSAIGAAGSAVTVGYDSNTGALSITSNRYGSSSSIQINQVGSGGAAIGLNLASGSAAQDVAGTIDGVAATGSGTRLTGGTGNASGLQVDVTSGSPGSRGTVNFDRFAINATNNTFKVKVDGTQSGLITLNSQTGLTNVQLALEIQTQINKDGALKAAGRSVQVGFDSGSGQLLIKSAGYGSGSNVEVSQISSGSSALGLTIKAGDPGLDVAGTIGGVAATGSGTKLTGTGDAEGLQIDVAGGVAGSRGTVGYSRGIAEQLNTVLNGFLGTGGVLTQQVNGLNDQEATITKQRDALTKHLTTYQAQLTAKFNAMDLIVGQLRATSDTLTGQLATLPFTAKTSN